MVANRVDAAILPMALLTMAAPGRRRSTYYGCTLLWAHRVDVALDVDGDVAVVGLLEDADDVEDGVRRGDVRQKGVAWLGVGVGC